MIFLNGFNCIFPLDMNICAIFGCVLVFPHFFRIAEIVYIVGSSFVVWAYIPRQYSISVHFPRNDIPGKNIEASNREINALGK